MNEIVKLNALPSRFEELSYPVTRVEAVAAYTDVVVSLADGESNLAELLSSLSTETFDGADELYAELNNVLPLEAVGEPGQSDGDA